MTSTIVNVTPQGDRPARIDLTSPEYYRAAKVRLAKRTAK